MLIQDISSPSKYKLSNIEISFSPPYFAQIDSVKKFRFSWRDITWSEYSCNHVQYHPTLYLWTFNTLCSSIFKKASFHIIPLISHQARHVFFTSFIFKPNPNNGKIEVLIRSVRSFDQNEMRGELLVMICRKNCGSNQAKSKRLKKCWIRPSPGEKLKAKLLFPHWPSPESWGA